MRFAQDVRRRASFRKVDPRSESAPHVHRTFAGISGAAAFAISVFHGWSTGDAATNVVPRAVVSLLWFALAGAVVGRLALWMVEEGVAARLHESLAAEKPKEVGKKK